VVDETGSALAREVWKQADAAISGQLVYPELRAAAAGVQRAGRQGRRWLQRAVETIDVLYDELDVVALDDALARSAGDLAERHALRGYDAVHLASALAIDVPGELVIATWDQELAAAALAEGRMVVPAQ
jgi:predicted nucleic acid-binding protein